MNLDARVSKLEAATDTRAPITLWSDGKTPEQLSAEIAERRGANKTRRVVLVGWKKPEGFLPAGCTSIATGVPRTTPTSC